MKDRLQKLQLIAKAHPRRVRREVLKILGELAKSERGLFYLAVVKGRSVHAVESYGFGPPEYMESIAILEGLNLRTLGDRANGSRAELFLEDPFFVNKFKIVDTDKAKDLEIYRVFFKPHRLSSVLGSYLMKGEVWRGWLGVYRTKDEPPFSRRDVANLRKYQQEIFAVLNTTVEVDHWNVPAGGMIGMLNRAGNVVGASADATEWFKEGDVCKELKAAARAFMNSGAAHRETFVRRHAVQLTRMEGGGEPKALVRISPTCFFTVPPLATLTPRQREVARVLMTGGTLAETAQALDISIETVRTHLKAIYERLAVTNRVELTCVLSEQ